MRSIRTKITILTISSVMIAIIVAALLGTMAIRSMADENAERTLHLLCETGQKNLDAYFDSIEQSVGMVASFADSDLKNLEEEELRAHVDRTRDIFAKAANRTNGVLTYYYRIDPAVSDKVKGFWYTNLDGEGFAEHEVTDITLYDTEDTSSLVWFTVPKATGRALWLPPYVTDNLDVLVLSYNVPIYLHDTFVGVIGIEIDYSTMADQVDHIRLYTNGYAFINDAEGIIIYHPRMTRQELEEENKRETPYGMLDESSAKDCDLILLCVYPEAAIDWLREMAPHIGPHPMVIDCCGTKQVVCEACFPLAQQYGIIYLGGHPMAGSHFSGYAHARADLYHGAPMVLVPPTFDDIELLSRAKELLSPAGFGRYPVTTAEKHDASIAFTSQLAHLVSNAYVKSPTALEHHGFSAGSYRDMTRVAWLNAPMWTELFLDNRDNLLRELDLLIENLGEYRDALERRDARKLESLLEEGKRRKEEVDQ